MVPPRVLVYKQISIETALQNETGLFSFWVRAQARTLLTRKARTNLRWNENPYHFEDLFQGKLCF